MENYPYSSPYPDSGDSSPRSREIEAENAVSWEEMPPPAPFRVKLMCSYGGRIQPRPHDNQLSYVGGETKILAVDRSVRFSSVLFKLASMYSTVSPDDICFKYQLPGEDLDSLISVTNDEDLEHMMIEYDRLHRQGSKPTSRLRLFLFTTKAASTVATSAAEAELKSDRQWFVEGLNSIPAQLAPALDHNPLQPSPPPPVTQLPDFLSGIFPLIAPDKGKDPALEHLVVDSLSVEAPVARSDLVKGDRQQIVEQTLISPSTEVQIPVPEIQRLHLAENQHQQQLSMKPDGIEETLSRVYHGEYYAARVQGKAPPSTTQISSTAYWPDHRSIAATYNSVGGGDQPVYLFPASHGIYNSTTGQGYYTAAPPQAAATAAPLPRVVPAEVYREAPAMYAVPMPSMQPGNVFGSQYPEGSAALQAASGADITAYAAAQVAYDSSGRAMFFTPGALPAYQTVTSVTLNPEAEVARPSQVS